MSLQLVDTQCILTVGKSIKQLILKNHQNYIQLFIYKKRYIDSINLRNTVLNKNLKETFCPLCETISNNSILITPRNSQPDLNEYLNEFLSYENWYSSVQNIFNNNYNNQEETIELNKDVSEQISHLNLMVDINNNNLTIDESSKKLVEEFTLNLAELTSHDSKNESNLYSSVWSNCSYTIQAAG